MFYEAFRNAIRSGKVLLVMPFIEANACLKATCLGDGFHGGRKIKVKNPCHFCFIPLHEAIKYRSTEVIEALLNNDADCNLQGSWIIPHIWMDPFGVGPLPGITKAFAKLEAAVNIKKYSWKNSFT